ncbi:hypothetical protein [Corynebacterium heidelbergense]|uniref:Secreted protein n=1 Tax=Corynebacterium heidelbergense TaxID=2055947 RepID=A0A364V621_9CORY|nr:hypothetical protein [Corynebacterium heidelbergense]RAV32069.1 hypothetical protein DLJ54_05085 [Corynebacterium heidelbergense]
MNGSLIILVAGVALLLAAAGLLWRSGSRTPPSPARPKQPDNGPVTSSRKRRRKTWAAAHEAEFAREDKELPRQWPSSIITAVDPEHTAPARDVVSGFFEGHPLHIADVGAGTLMAMRRAQASDVSVHYSRQEAVPAGMRRSELLDQPPYFGYTTDVRALDRMLDSRVEDGLAALSEVVSDVVWGDQWLVLRVSRRLELSVWDAIVPHMVALADAAMVLPPTTTTTVVDRELADPTRPLFLTDVHIDPPAARSGEQPQERAETERAGAPRSFLRAVADAPAGDRPLGAESAGQGSAGEPAAAAESAQPVTDATSTGSVRQNDQASGGRAAASEAGDSSAQGAAEDNARPDVTRPVDPPEFPSRFTARAEGDTGHFASSRIGDDLDTQHPEIPSIGEDPDHIDSRNAAGQPRVYRGEDTEATIFQDGESSAVQLSPTAVRRRSEGQRMRGGRHRAPEARHARPRPIEPVEIEEDIETVDGEIVPPKNRGDLPEQG